MSIIGTIHLTTGEIYAVPEWILEANCNAEDHYSEWHCNDILTGAEDFERLVSEGFDPKVSQCIEVYADHFGIEIDQVNIESVKTSLFAHYVMDGDDFVMVYLNRLN